MTSQSSTGAFIELMARAAAMREIGRLIDERVDGLPDDRTDRSTIARGDPLEPGQLLGREEDLGALAEHAHTIPMCPAA